MEEKQKFHIKPGTFIKQSLANDYSSSYKGLHSDESQSFSFSQKDFKENLSLSENNSNNELLSDTLSSNDINTTKENYDNNNTSEILYTFIWDEGGKNVKVTGSFVNWSTSFDMKYYPEEKVFKYSHLLTKEKHSYKFIVDGIWKCNQKQPMIKDNSNNTNNFIDLSNYILPKKVEKEKTTKKMPKRKKEKKIIKKKLEEGYDIKFPSKDDLNIEAPVVKEDYLETFLIDSHTNQNFIGRSLYLNFKTNEPFTEEKSYKELLLAPHISINHSLKSVNKLDLLETGMNFRFRDKNCTLVYYSHQPK